MFRRHHLPSPVALLRLLIITVVFTLPGNAQHLARVTYHAKPTPTMTPGNARFAQAHLGTRMLLMSQSIPPGGSGNRPQHASPFKATVGATLRVRSDGTLELEHTPLDPALCVRALEARFRTIAERTLLLHADRATSLTALVRTVDTVAPAIDKILIGTTARPGGVQLTLALAPRGTSLNLPSSRTAKNSEEPLRTDAIILRVTAQGTLVYRGTPVTPARLSAALQPMVAQSLMTRGHAQAIVLGDAAAPCGTVFDAMDLLLDLGASDSDMFREEHGIMLLVAHTP